MKRETSLLVLGRMLGITGTLFMIGIFALETHYAQARPRVPDEGRGRVYPLNVHGIVYVTSSERRLDRNLGIAAAACWIPFASIVYIEVRRRKRDGGNVE